MARRPRGEVDDAAVEFMVDEPPPGRDEDLGQTPQARRWVAAIAVVIVAAAVGVALINTPHRAPRAPRAASKTLHRTSSAPPTPVHTVHIDPPTRAIERLFAHVLPGSVVVAEQSKVRRHGDGAPALRSRILDVVVGNVQVDVIVHPSDAPGHRLPGSTRLRHGGFLIDFAFSGYYPPSPAVLRALADDPRLTAVDS